MDNGIYIALSRQTALFRKMDMVAHNIANLDSTGFQAEKVMFDDYVVKEGNRQKIAFAQDVASYRDTAQGNMKTTHNPLDVAINGDGYFVVETANGERYTRAGNFQLDAEGTLVTAEGFPVLDDSSGQITFSPNDKEIVIGEAGNISVDGELRGNLGVVEFANAQSMVQIGNGLLKTDQEPLEAENSRVLHGVLEKSNVKAIEEVVNLVKLSKSVGSTSKYIEVMYELQKSAHDAYTRQTN